jgi:predicted component of type VI protein secretion system
MTPTDNDLTIIRPLSAQILLVRDPSGQIRRVPLLSGEMTVGRGADNALVLDQDDQSVSRHHAVITVDGPVVMIADRGSTNGVLVNGVRVERAALKPGDEVRLGKTVLTIEAAAPQPVAPPSERGGPAASGAKKRALSRTILYLAVLAVLVILVGVMVFSGPDKPAPPPHTQATARPASPSDAPAVPPPAAPTALPVKDEPATARPNPGRERRFRRTRRTYRPSCGKISGPRPPGLVLLQLRQDRAGHRRMGKGRDFGPEKRPGAKWLARAEASWISLWTSITARALRP